MSNLESLGRGGPSYLVMFGKHCMHQTRLYATNNLIGTANFQNLNSMHNAVACK